MWSASKVAKRLIDAGVSGRVWGLRGPEAVARIERGLGVALGEQLRHFVSAVGNVMVSPFEIVLGGDDAGRYSAVTQTQMLWNEYPALKQSKLVQVMDYAGEVYLYHPEDERVSAYDSLRPVLGEETFSWNSSEEFIGWLFDEAKHMKEASLKTRWRRS